MIQARISRWVANEKVIRAHAGIDKKKINRERQCFYPQLEDSLYTWILNKPIVEKVSISHDDLVKKAKLKAKSSEDPEVYNGFKYSNGWVQNFMERHHLSSRAATHRAQENNKSKLSKAVIMNYIENLNRVNRGYPPQFILQMDETRNLR